MSRVAVLGAGMAACGVVSRLRAHGVQTTVYEQHGDIGGHASSRVLANGFVFDDGPHISFTKDARIRALFSAHAGGAEETFTARVNNYWRGRWIKHPAQCNLHGLPTDLVVRILSEIAAVQHAPAPAPAPASYAEWLVATFGRTFAETFPMQYGRKYHTTEAANMTVDWLGPRLYRPKLEEVLRGALAPTTDDVHYVSDFRYPTHGGFVAYLRPFLREADVRLRHRVTRIDASARQLEFADGRTAAFDALVSSLPLPVLVPMIDGAPAAVRAAAARLACTSCVIVNIGVDRPDLSQAHWTYFYDDDFVFTRLSFPHMFSPGNAPPGAGSIQAEVYRSAKYRPLEAPPETFIDPVLADLRRCGLLRPADRVLMTEATVAPFANVIFDHERPAALATVRAFLDETGIQSCGRYGEWGYHWTDESFLSGERAADRALAALEGGRLAPSLETAEAVE